MLHRFPGLMLWQTLLLSGALWMLCSPCVLIAQPICGVEEREQFARVQAPWIAARVLALEESIADWVGGTELRSVATVTIPVVVHIVYHNEEENLSEDRIYRQLERLELDFNGNTADRDKIPVQFRDRAAAVRFSFCLADTDPSGAPSQGIVRVRTEHERIGLLRAAGGRQRVFYEDLGGSDSWDTERYLNLYVCDLGSIGGFAAGPFTAAYPEEDAVVVNYRYFGPNDSGNYGLGRIATHEVGHFFGLRHTWGETEGCTTDDGVMDTPRQFGPYTGCPSWPQISCGGASMYMNFMDYVDDACMHLFTAGQKLRMWASLHLARHRLLEEPACGGLSVVPDRRPFRCFPNPVAAGPFVLARVDSFGETMHYTLTDIQGRRLLQGVWQDGVLSLDVTGLSAGVYMLTIGTTEERYVVKLLKVP